jgi:hypothetical protein
MYHLGQSDDADKYIQLANERQTEWPTVAAGLAWEIATRRPSSPYQKAQAIVYARAAALATNHQNPEVLDSLAAAQAAIGQYAEAATTANQAVTIAEKRGLMVLASRIRERVKLYESGQPFIRP